MHRNVQNICYTMLSWCLLCLISYAAPQKDEYSTYDLIACGVTFNADGTTQTPLTLDMVRTCAAATQNIWSAEDINACAQSTNPACLYSKLPPHKRAVFKAAYTLIHVDKNTPSPQA